MGTERGGCSRLMKTPRHNGGAVHSRSMRAKMMTVAAAGTEQNRRKHEYCRKGKTCNRIFESV